MAKKQGHYCKFCGEYKSNESFTGKGHAAHICKKCVALPAAQRSEDMTLTKLWNLPWKLTQQQRDWLRELQNDKRPEVASAAREVYAGRFPYAERNERKKQLHIRHMELAVQGEVYNEYGDAYYKELHFVLDRKECTVRFREEDMTEQVVLTEKEMRKLLNSIVNNYEVFCWEEDYGWSNRAEVIDPLWSDEELSESDNTIEAISESEPSWEVAVSYLNGETQKMCGYDELPDRINELLLDLLAFFEDADDDDAKENDER